MSGFLLRSLVLSAVLTVLLNVFLGWRGRRVVDDPLRNPSHAESGSRAVERRDAVGPGPSVRIHVPWRAMLIVSVGLTVVLNLVAWLVR